MTAVTTAPTSAPGADDTTGPWRHLPAYRQIVRSRVQMAFVYRRNSIFLLALVVVQIYVLNRVWTALYAGHDAAALHRLVVYITVTNLQSWVLQDPSVGFYMYERIREGVVAFDLVRPLGFVQQMFAHLLGSRIGALLFVLPAVPIVTIFGALSPPASVAAGLLYVVSLAAAYVIAMLLSVMLGMVAFWTLETQGLTLLYIFINRFLGGALIPLTLFPHAVAVVAYALPFQAMAFTPVAIYVGQLSGSRALVAIGVQLLWVALLSWAAASLWRRAISRVVVQGG